MRSLNDEKNCFPNWLSFYESWAFFEFNEISWPLIWCCLSGSIFIEPSAHVISAGIQFSNRNNFIGRACNAARLVCTILNLIFLKKELRTANGMSFIFQFHSPIRLNKSECKLLAESWNERKWNFKEAKLVAKIMPK